MILLLLTLIIAELSVMVAVVCLILSVEKQVNDTICNNFLGYNNYMENEN